ncbi:glycosyltransferase [Mesobacillus zeae]|uniref:Glycosyltransferase family 2 protein n=1 Tax=Mesobacillus zeae TaxID=1917180 RepID=A0A398BID0_9BACI|nr:hypothetical protein [Mesobacillus zeae]RID88801.1 hypothetical protein D1970_00710 [Mesobacillus zeae]
MKISIIIPIKSTLNKDLRDFTNYIISLSSQLQKTESQIIIADESELASHLFMKEKFKNRSNISHIIPDDEIRTGANDKLNGIYAALKYVRYDNILLVDDHYRITYSTLQRLANYFNQYDCFKGTPKFDAFPFSVKIDLCGLFIVNMLDYRKQYSGHLAFKKKLIDEHGFPDRDALFDEFAMEKHFRKNQYSIGYIREASLEATQSISMKKFLEQRVRYAYENIAFPIRFVFFLSILPLLLLLLITNNLLPLYFAAALTIGAMSVSFIGQLKYGKGIVPRHTFLYSAIWFWFYPFTSWLSIYKYFTGGVEFGGNKVRKAA